MRKTKTITVGSVDEVTRGIKGGRPWVLYKVFDENANDYTTFEAKYLDLVGQKVEISYDEETVPGKKEGQVFTNRKIVEKARPETVNAFRKGAGLEPKPPHELEEINRKLDKIITFLENQTPPF